MLRCTQVPEHEESWYSVHLAKPLDSRVKLALLVVNSVELHLTAFKNKFNNGRNESPPAQLVYVLSRNLPAVFDVTYI